MAARKNPEFYELFAHLGEQAKSDEKPESKREPAQKPAPPPPQKQKQPPPPSPLGLLKMEKRDAVPPQETEPEPEPESAPEPEAEPEAAPEAEAPAETPEPPKPKPQPNPPAVDAPKPKPQPRPPAVDAPVPPKEQREPVKPASAYPTPPSPYGGGYQPPGWVLTRDKLAALGVLIVALIVGAFLLGVMVGGRGTRPMDEPEGPAVSSTDGADRGGSTAGNVSTDTESTAGVADAGGGEDADTGPSSVGGTEPRHHYKLRIISGVRPSTARDITKELSRRGYEDVMYSSNNGRYTVYVGTFDSATSEESLAFKRKVSQEPYLRGTPFRDCYFVRVESNNGN